MVRKLVAFLVYAAILLPTGDYRVTAWIRAVEVTSTALDKTLRRKKSRIESDRLSRHLQLTQIADGDKQDLTGRLKNGQFLG